MNSLKNYCETFNLNWLTYLYRTPMTILEMLLYLGFNTQIIVIDYNGRVLQKDLWKKTRLKKQDSIEILTIAGGG